MTTTTSAHNGSGDWRGAAKEGFFAFLPLSIGLIPWAIVTGIAMRASGFTLAQAMGMQAIVYAGAAQLATLPLIVSEAPLWVIVATALVLNLRFAIFSAAIAPGFTDMRFWQRLFCGSLLIDMLFVMSLDKMLTVKDRHWRFAYYTVPAVWAWSLWQVFGLVGSLGAELVPRNWSLEFMATIALLFILVPLLRDRAGLLAALVGGICSVLLYKLPLNLNVFSGIILGIGVGYLAELSSSKKDRV